MSELEFDVQKQNTELKYSCLQLAKEILLPLLFFPLQCGILLASVSISIQVASNSLLGTFSSDAWWTILFMYPIIFTVLGILLSNILLQEQ